MRTNEYSTAIKWWLIIIPIALWFISGFLAFIGLIAVGYVIYNQYKKDKLSKEFLQDLEQSLRRGNVNVDIWDFDCYPLTNNNFKNHALSCVQSWGEQQLNKLSTFDDIFNNYKVQDYLDAAQCRQGEDSAILNAFWSRAEKCFKEQKQTLIDKIRKVKYAKTLSDILNDLPDENYGANRYFKLKSQLTNHIEERLAKMEESEIGFPYQIKCKLKLQMEDYEFFLSTEEDYSFDESEDSFDYEDFDDGDNYDNYNNNRGLKNIGNVLIKISKDSMTITGGDNGTIPLDNIEVIDIGDDFIKLTTRKRRETLAIELSGLEPVVPAWILRHYSDIAREKVNDIKKRQLNFELTEVNDVAVNGRKCYYVCEASFVRKVVEQDGELFCVGTEENAKIYVTERSVEIVANSHISLDLRNILNLRLNGYNDILMIVRRGYSNALGLTGDIEVLEKAIRHAQQKILNV